MEKPVYLTNTGKTMMLNALSGQTIAFTNFAVGNGVIENPTEADIKAMTALVSPVIPDISITSGTEQNAYVRLRGEFSSQDEFITFGWSELGIYACGQGNQSFTGDGTTATFAITNTTYMVYYIEMTESGSTSVVPEEDYTFDTATNSVVFDTAPASGSTIKVYFPDMTDKKLFAYGYDENAKEVRHTDESSVAQVYEIEEVFSIDDNASIVIKLDTTNSYVTSAEFENHVNDKNNPHEVTAEQIGITGDAGTVVVNNMKPSFTIAENLQDITSGDTISTLFGKIARAIRYLRTTVANHIANRNNPHNVTYIQTGAAAASHTHDASAIVSGTIPISRGGTGVTTLAELQALVAGGGGKVSVEYYIGNDNSNRETIIWRTAKEFTSAPIFAAVLPSFVQGSASIISTGLFSIVSPSHTHLVGTSPYLRLAPGEESAYGLLEVANTCAPGGTSSESTYDFNLLNRPYVLIYALEDRRSSFTYGTDSDVSSLIDAARRGSIDLQRDAGWRVGDTRKIHIDGFTYYREDGNRVTWQAHDIDIVITEFGDYNSSGSLFQFDFYENIEEDMMYPASEEPFNVKYGESGMYQYTMPALVNALPSWLKSRLLTFTVVATSSQAGVENVPNNKLALRSSTEVLGPNFGGSAEGSWVQLYRESPSLKEKLCAREGTSTCAWWLRTATAACFTLISKSGTPDTANGVQGANFGVAPFGCL